MKKFLLLITLLAGLSPKIFANDQDLIVVELHDDTPFNIALSENMKITWRENVMADSVVFQHLGEETAKVPFTKVKKLTFDASVVSGIADTKASVPAPTFSLSGSVLSVSGVAPGSKVCAFTIDGRQCGSAVANSDGNASISLPSLDRVFVIKTSSASFKIIKK